MQASSSQRTLVRPYVANDFLHMGMYVGEPYWSRWLRRKLWQPVLAGLILRWSVLRDLSVRPAPGHPSSPGLRYRIFRLHLRGWRPIVASLVNLKPGEPGLRCQSYSPRLRRRRPTMAYLMLNRSL